MAYPPYFFGYLILLSVLMFFEFVFIYKKNSEQALAIFVGIIFTIIGLSINRIWAF
jgi:hypothetical protein